MNTQHYFDTFNDSETDAVVATDDNDQRLERLRMDYYDLRQKAWDTGASSLDYKGWLEQYALKQQEYTHSLRQQLAAVTTELETLKTALAEALDSANYWHSQCLLKGGE